MLSGGGVDNHTRSWCEAIVPNVKGPKEGILKYIKRDFLGISGCRDGTHK